MVQGAASRVLLAGRYTATVCRVGSHETSVVNNEFVICEVQQLTREIWQTQASRLICYWDTVSDLVGMDNNAEPGRL